MTTASDRSAPTLECLLFSPCSLCLCGEKALTTEAQRTQRKQLRGESKTAPFFHNHCQTGVL